MTDKSVVIDNYNATIKMAEYLMRQGNTYREHILKGKQDNFKNKAVSVCILTIVTQSMAICEQVFAEAVKTESYDAKKDLKEIKGRINQFIDNMIGQLQ